MQSSKKRAVCLLSGGLDSATVLAIAVRDGYAVDALSFDYGQRHRREIRSAKALAQFYRVNKHIILKLPKEIFGGSSLTVKEMRVPVADNADSIGKTIPSTYVPGRNIVFLSIACSYAESVGADVVFIGANAVDFSGYPDCRPAFFRAFRKMISEGTVVGRKLRIEVPLLNLSKAKIIKTAQRYGVPFGLTWSCYSGGKKPCGKCDTCVLRADGFRDAGIKDPLLSGGDSFPADC